MIATAEPLVDVLPERDGKRFTIRWSRGPVYPDCGVVEIQSKRDATSYAVVSVPTSWSGRAFHFEKVAGAGTDAQEKGYDVFVCTDARQSRCDCKGFARWGHCRHLDAAATLIANEWI